MKPPADHSAEIFNRILEQARTDPNILGFILTGSRGNGNRTEHSDYDFVLLVREDAAEEYKRRQWADADPQIDPWVASLEEFRRHAAWGSDTAWDRYNYAHLRPQVDKTGELAELLREKGSLPESARRKFVSGHLDGYVNQVYRSMKCFRDGQMTAARLEAADSVRPMLDVLFGLHGRLRPFHKYLEWELKKHPLEKLTLAAEDLLRSLLQIVETGAIPVQQRILTEVERIARADGYGSVLDGWEWRLDWMKQFSL